MSTHRIKIHAVGDIMLGEGPCYLDRGVGTSIEKHGSDFAFEPISGFPSDADLAFDNLEVAYSTLGEGKGLRSGTLREPDEGIGVSKKGGVNLLGLANNHYLTHGNAVAEDTKERPNQAGIETIGWAPRQPLLMFVKEMEGKMA